MSELSSDVPSWRSKPCMGNNYAGILVGHNSLLCVFFMILPGSKSTPASFAFITQFKEKMKTKMMQVLIQVFPCVRPATSSSLFSPHPECYIFILSPFQRQNDQHHQSPAAFALGNSDWKRCRKGIQQLWTFYVIFAFDTVVIKSSKKATAPTRTSGF